MIALLFLFLTVPAVFSADPKCPKGFFHFKRTPTARNNYTSDWCMIAVPYPNMGNRDRARSFCNAGDAALSIPENRHEFEVLSRDIRKYNISGQHAMDGEISQRCKAHILKLYSLGKTFNDTTEKGECNIKRNLFMFDDINTDPSFVLSNFVGSIPNRHASLSETDAPTFHFIGSCLTMTNTHNATAVEFADTGYCVGENLVKNYTEAANGEKINSVICGLHPK